MSREGLKLSLLENNNGGGSSSGNNNGAPTLTTPTLTPTTLRNIEQMLLDSGESPVLHACEPPELHENAAGFVPPSVELPMTSEYEADDKLQSSLDWVLTQPGNQVPNNAPYNSPPPPPPPQPVPPVIASLIKDPSAAALPGPTNILLPLLSNLTPVSSMNSTSQSIATALPSVPSCSLINNPDNHSSSSNPPSMPAAPAPVVNHNNNNVVINAKKRNAVQSVGNRRNGSSSIAVSNNNNNNNNIHSNDSSQLTPEEKLKRDLRRERNKEAAARCRKRRLDQTLNLQDEVEELDSKKMSLQKELESLRAQKEELEVLLNNHKAGHCAVIGSVVKKEPLEEPACIIKTELSESSTNLACTVGGQ